MLYGIKHRKKKPTNSPMVAYKSKWVKFRGSTIRLHYPIRVHLFLGHFLFPQQGTGDQEIYKKKKQAWWVHNHMHATISGGDLSVAPQYSTEHHTAGHSEPANWDSLPLRKSPVSRTHLLVSVGTAIQRFQPPTAICT